MGRQRFEEDAMTQPRKILWFVLFLEMLLLLPARGAAQNYVTPVVQPTPPGPLITVNNGPGDENRFPLQRASMFCHSG
jgi:hypothetical protein